MATRQRGEDPPAATAAECLHGPDHTARRPARIDDGVLGCGIVRAGEADDRAGETGINEHLLQRVDVRLGWSGAGEMSALWER